MRPFPLPPDDLRPLLIHGYAEELALAYGVTTTDIARWRRALGVTRPDTHERGTAAAIMRLLEGSEQSYTSIELSTLIGRSYSHTRAILRQLCAQRLVARQLASTRTRQFAWCLYRNVARVPLPAPLSTPYPLPANEFREILRYAFNDEVAWTYGVSARTISRWRAELGVAHPSRHDRGAAALILAYLATTADWQSTATITQAIGRSYVHTYNNLWALAGEKKIVHCLVRNHLHWCLCRNDNK